MPDSDKRIDAFLASKGWADARREPLAGDASARRYLRLVGADSTAILMDAPPEICGPQDNFIRTGARLRAIGLSTPETLAYDTDHGLILMEDLGDLVFSRLIEHDGGLEKPLYAAATDALVQMQSVADTTGSAGYGPTEMASAIRLAWTHYLHHNTAPSEDWMAVEHNLEAILLEHDAPEQVFVHRDYHAENLLWLPDREGLARLGVLDFQDAVAGHPAYDLASLLQDARRDVPEAIEDEMIARFTRARRLPERAFRAAYAAQATQRHLRILGIFARLAEERGKPRYLQMMPRVWRDLQRNLQHPALEPIRDRLHALLPAPAP